jgi:hypothetical protein
MSAVLIGRPTRGGRQIEYLVVLGAAKTAEYSLGLRNNVLEFDDHRYLPRYDLIRLPIDSRRPALSVDTAVARNLFRSSDANAPWRLVGNWSLARCLDPILL